MGIEKVEKCYIKGIEYVFNIIIEEIFYIWRKIYLVN